MNNRLFRFNDNGTIREFHSKNWIRAFKTVVANFPHLRPQPMTVVNLTEVK